ncbi:4-coumarate--CoA ligase family protein [Pseudoclavibacter chungangensis]|uniref:4-coumarate--CoA ligase family protein n=1 Tax=Pseudoclavibacter chungangensis TaxID=587635 RepID=A0A7J5BSC1_9MICO|nr:AMP-binding protein [Pseudoclavibacter chungangensis]KAB1655955.1 4-coumarate--CoA ligase family protein [Pseudoclavibacter chungangensis]NYJ66399.1 acyl-CoA synthetase (AMP-forming)/AMP-acid ligase II [Pseudoclavibacter chungangensis]
MIDSPYPDVEIPDLTVYDYLFGDLDDADRDRPAFIAQADGAETSYASLVAQIDAFAGALAERGVGPGTVVGLLSPNVPAFVTAFHGVLRAGATATTINALFTADEIAKQLRDARATWLVTVSPLLPQGAAAAAEVGIPDERVIVLDGADGHPSLRDLLAEGRPAPEVEIDPATHLAVLPYSSGTTGTPKGVMLTHRNLVANVAQCIETVRVEPSDRVLAVLPFFHIYGMTVLLNLALRRRAALVPMPRFDLVDFLTTIEERRCTYVFIAPPIAVALAKHPVVDQFDISSVHTLLSGAASLDGETGRRAAERIGARMLQGYGMTELSPVSHVIPADRPDIPLDSIGIPVPNVRSKLVDPATGEEIVAHGADGATPPGELWVQGPNVMAGYLGRPEETAATIDADGYLHTGDIAVHHEAGYFTIVDRLKELIKYKGYQIAPAELEALLLSHPKIADAAVIGVLDDDREEVPKAFVVRAEDSLDADEVIAFVADRVAPHKKVRRVAFVDAIPKSGSAKILRKDLRAVEPEAAAVE